MILSIIGIILGLIAIGLFIWLRKDQQMDNGLHAAEVDHIHQGMNALMNDFNNYQVETDRKIAELEKQLNLKIGSTYREHDKLRKDQTMDSDLHSVETDHIHQGMNALMNDFNHYQVETDRKIAELEKKLENKTNKTDRKIDKVIKNMPAMVGKVVGQIELAQEKINR